MMEAMDVIDVSPDVDVDEDDPGPRGLSWGRAVVLAVAVGFLGFAVALVVTRDRPPGADSVDVGFLQDMLTHHEQALGVATVTIARGEDPVVRSFAREVLTEQGYETGVMTQKLNDWGYSRQDRSDQAMAWMDMAVPVADMPGLLSREELDQIDSASGRELDALFLEKMAEHHRGGLHMAQYAAEHASDADVRALAARMVRNQSGEINEYRLAAQQRGFDVDIPPASVPPDLPSS
jgi:uncharacterized protein (DUF305 family)